MDTVPVTVSDASYFGGTAVKSEGTGTFSSAPQTSQTLEEEQYDSTSMEPMPLFNRRDALSKHSKFLITDYNISGISSNLASSQASSSPVVLPRKSMRVLLDHPLSETDEESSRKSQEIQTNSNEPSLGGTSDLKPGHSESQLEDAEPIHLVKNQVDHCRQSQFLLTDCRTDALTSSSSSSNYCGCAISSNDCSCAISSTEHSRNISTPTSEYDDEDVMPQPVMSCHKDALSRKSKFLVTDYQSTLDFTPVVFQTPPTVTSPASE